MFDCPVTGDVNETRAVVTNSDGCQSSHLLQSGAVIGGFVGEGTDDDGRLGGHWNKLPGVDCCYPYSFGKKRELKRWACSDL